MILKGSILLATNINQINQVLTRMPDTKIISMSEERDIDPRYVLSGTILLPPIEAIIAEVDGNEQKYDMIYSRYLFSSNVKEYMASILAYLYKGGKLLLYFPVKEYNNSINKLLGALLTMYGIHVGIIGDPNKDNATCYYDSNLEAFQLDLIYFYTGIIDWREYLYYYPINIPISDQMMNILFNNIRPYGDTFNERLEVINRLRIGIKANPYLSVPIMQV
jgi:hypothetical protein